MIQFYATRNMLDPELVECAPWDFSVTPEELEAVRKKSKPLRKQWLQQDGANWNLYSAVRGMALNQRVSKDNPPVGVRGLVADYDMKSTLESVQALINQIDPKFQPQFYELSLSKKARLVWVFEREVLVPSSEFATELYRAFCRKIKIPTLLPGFDSASEKPAQIWTNGGEWYNLRTEPLAWEVCFGILCDVSSKSSLFEKSEVPVETIAAEVFKRFPNKWRGDFKLDAIGVRFWDEKADNPTGCQVKPDGMLCFTGNQPFLKWSEIFGPQWVDEQKVLSLGNAGKDIFFDGRQYWEQCGGQWKPETRVDCLLGLTSRGLSDKTGKGQTISDAGRVLRFIQQNNRVAGAAPAINYAPGIITIRGQRVLNTTTIEQFKPLSRAVVKPQDDFPWLWHFLNGHFARPENRPLDYFLTWLRRSYKSMYEHKRYMGQSIFLCGPADNGKTLLCLRVVAPLLGNRIANPFSYLTGETTFNDDLFESGLWAINDEEAPATEAIRNKMLAKLKASVVNPTHIYSAKFCSRVPIDWTGRLFFTLNHDATSVGLLSEVNSNTQDKMMFFASKDYEGQWGEQDETEATINRELPAFARWLLDTYKPPQDILLPGRMGMKSFFDPVILELSRQQVHAYNFLELLALWIRTGIYFQEANVLEWTGTPTDLLANLTVSDTLSSVLRDWTVPKVAKSLTTLAKLPGTGVELVANDSERNFRIIKSVLLKELKKDEAPAGS